MTVQDPHWRYCPHCGRPWGRYVTDCYACGAPLPPAAIDVPDSCPSCGGKLVPDPAGVWCPRAGCAGIADTAEAS